MIKFDFDSTVYKRKNNYETKEELLNKLNNYDMTGWIDKVSNDVDEMLKKVEEVKSHSKALVVIGIGGSYLGSKALYDMFSNYFTNDFKVYYAGYNLSSNYLNDLVNILKDTDFSINVISKSGNTMEIKLTYSYIKKFMEEKYSQEELQKRIIFTTGDSGYLHDEAVNNGYYTMSIPDNIGGRYSMMTPAHLFPLAFNIDIKKLIEGYNDGDKYIDDAYNYAINRFMLFNDKKYVENFVTFEPKYSMINEWIKQLFGESEGKNKKGVFPTSTVFTRDLHSLGQFIQEGNNILFETFLIIRDNTDFKVDGKDLEEINNNIIDAVRIAHYKGNVSVNFIEIDELNEYNIGSIIKFFFYSAAFSSILFGVNPFDQPGVEVYKKEIRNKFDN